jgi:SAM-dependent methyltransferase
VAQGSSTFSSASGDDYELSMGRWSRRLAGKFLDFCGVTDSGALLDAGCGTGALSAELIRRTEKAQIVAVDISPVYVAHAKGSAVSERVRFETGDLTALTFVEHEFDQVFSQLVLQFVPETERAISELVRVTKPGGRVSAAVWDMRGGLTFMRFVLDTAAMLDPAADQLRARAFTRPLTRPGELRKAWEGAGLQNVRAGDLTIRMEFSSFGDFWAPFDGEDGPVPTYLRTVPPDLCSEIKEAIRRAYVDGEEDGPRSYTATTWVVTGEKPG